MVLYYSGTGNSKYVASRLADTLGDTLFCMTERIKQNDTSPVNTGERVIIVTPTYAWRIPRLVKAWLLKTELTGAKKAWFVMSCGSEIGNAAKYNRALCRDLGLEYMSTAQIIMPENYIAMFDAPDIAESRAIVAKAEPHIDRAAAAIAEGKVLDTVPVGAADRIKSGPVNPVFYSFFVKAEAFTADDRCIGCGKCAKLCPTNSITLENGNPVWGKGCTHCMACICYCPTEAIEYGKISLSKPRYHFEALSKEK